MSDRFRAIWPIVNESIPWADLIAEARRDLAIVAGQAHCRPDWRAGRWSLARSVDVPGSGRTTASVLVYEAPATPIEARPYHARREAS